MDVKIWPTSFHAVRDYNNNFCFDICEKGGHISMQVENPKELIEILTRAYNDRNTN